MHITEAIVLKKTDVGEADVLYTAYTREFGKMRMCAVGVKKEEAKLRGHCEPLHHVEIGFVLGKNGARLVHAALIRPWYAIQSDSARSSTALRIAQRIDDVCFDGEKDSVLWDFFLANFHELERGTSGRDFLQEFEQKFSVVLGTGV